MSSQACLQVYDLSTRPLFLLNPLQFDKQLNLGLVRSAAARESGLDVEEFEARLQVHHVTRSKALHCRAV